MAKVTGSGISMNKWWFVPVRFPYKGSEEFREEIKKIPGVTWEPKGKTWYVPTEMLQTAYAIAFKYGVEISV